MSPCTVLKDVKLSVELVPPSPFFGLFTHYSGRLHDFSIVIPKCYKTVFSNNISPP